MKVTLLLHFYIKHLRNDSWIGARLIEVEVLDGRMLQVLVDLLARGVSSETLVITDEYPMDNVGNAMLNRALAAVYSEDDRYPNQIGTFFKYAQANRVSVMQIVSMTRS